MSDVAIQLVLDNLKQIAVYNANLIINVKDEVEGLIRDLAIVKAFIEDSTEKISEHSAVRELLTSIRALAFEAEDAIDAFVVETTDRKSKKWIQKGFGAFDHKEKLRQVEKKFETVGAELKKIYDNPIFGYEAREGGDPSGRRRMERKIPDVEKDNVVGFDTAATMLIDLLIGKTEDLQVISIIGMGGLGKTTLANKVYNDPRVVHEFSTRFWIYVSQTYRKKELFLSILKSVTQVTSEMSNMGDDKLADEVRRNLTWKYLIVVDDVWEKDDWDNIRKAFPDNKNGSRILLTSRNEPVAVYASLHSPGCKLEPYKLDFLTDQQSWELLQIKVFGGEVPEKNHDLMDAGIRIALECKGLPLAVVVIARVLQTNKRKDWWETVANSVDALLVRDEEVCIKVLALSYHHLSPYLKACLLYFGVFREDYEIPVWILIRLWIAEGFVQKIGNACLEEMAEKHLEDLVERNLVLVVQRSFSGRIKTCRIHDMLRDFCLKKALEESFLSEMKVDGKSPITPDVSIINRRLCIHSGVEKYISSKPSGLRVRSFLCFAKDQVNLPRSHVAYIPEEFKLLRVYHIQPIRSPRFPSEIEKLVYLKYVAFSGDFKTIPASMSKLWNLETLIVETSSRTIDIQADIWNMLQLRHLHTNAASELHCPVDQKDKNRDNAIQTLSTITPESCTILGKTPSIKKLGIRGKLATLLENGGSLFDNLTNLQQLVTLKLLNDTFPFPPSEMKLQGLPSRKLPPNLKRLTLADTFLDWTHMSVLEMLLELEELKLKDNAFVGVRWSLLDGGFKKLKALQIYKTDLVYWEAKADHFPSLQHIVLKDCRMLWAIPSSLGTSKTLRTIKLHQTSRAAAASAWDIKQHLGNGLELDIFPSDLGQGLLPVRVQDLRDEIEGLRKQLLQLEFEHRVEIEDLRKQLLQLERVEIEDLRKQLLQLEHVEIEDLRKQLLQLELEHRVEIKDLTKQLLQLELEQRDEIEDLRKQLLQLELEQKLKQKQYFEPEDSTSNQGSDWESKTTQAETKKDAQELVKDYTPYEISYALKSYTDSLGFTIRETPKVSHVGKVAVQLINVSSFFELDSMKNVEVLIVDCIMGTRKKRPIQILFEHDILSTYFPGREVPDRFVSKNIGSTISFTVTLSPYGYSRGLDLCLVYTLPADIDFLQSPLQVEIRITSSGIKRWYTPRCYGIPETGGDMVWLMHWVEEDLFKEGDVVQVSFNIGRNGQIKECGVRLLPCDKGAMLQCRETLRKSLKSNAFQVLPSPGFQSPDEQNLFMRVPKSWLSSAPFKSVANFFGFPTREEQNLPAPDPKAKGVEDSEPLPMQVHQYCDTPISVSDHEPQKKKREGHKKAEIKKDSQELVKAYMPYETSYTLKSYTDSLGLQIQETPKVSPVGKVDEQLISISGFSELDSMKNVEVLIADCVMNSRKKLPIQIMFEHDIISTYFPGSDVPDRFVPKNIGSMISFTVTLSPYGYSRGLDLCLVYTLPANIDFFQSPLQVEISITSSGIKRSYTPRCYGIPGTGGDMIWLIHWVEEDLFKEGDEVQVRFNIHHEGQIKECGVRLLPCPKVYALKDWGTLKKSLESNAFQVLPLPGFPTPDEQNLSAPDLKSREEEDSGRLQIQVRQYSDSTISISEDVGTSGTAPEGGVLSMEEFVVTEGQDLFPEDEESLTKLTDALSDVRVLSYTSTSMYTLPQYIFRLVALQKLFLRSCELLMMELPPEIGELKNLEVLDLEGTEILCLPMEIAKLVNLTCLKVSFYGYANQTVIPRGVLSNLLRLKELIIDVTPYGEWWDVEEVKAIIDDLHSLKELRTLKLYLPTAELLKYLTSISPGLANFRFAVGRHKEHFISRLPRDVEEEFNNWEKLEKGLKFINGDCIPNEITKVFKHADAFFLQRHWTAKSLSEFGHENMNEVKFCLVMECNEFQTVIDSEQYYQGKDSRSGSEDFLDFHETFVLGSLESLIIRYMKNMESIWKGPVGKGSLSNLKSLALHTCPILTTLFTVDMLINLTNLEELIVEDCPKIESLVSFKSTGSNSGHFLRSLKKISLLELPELVSISSGLWIAPNLERMVIFYCPKLEKLSTTEVSSTELKVIKAEKEWWDALKWYESDLSTEHEDYLARLFIPLRRDGDLMAQLTED